MRIGIDARFFGPTAKGLGRYVEKLVENLETIDQGSKNEYIIFLRKENWDAYHPKNLNFKKVLANYPWYSLTEQIMMPIVIWQNKIDLMHFPHFNIPIFCPTKFIVTIHDLIALEFSRNKKTTTLAPLLYKIKCFCLLLILKIGLWRAKKIITVSKCIKNKIVNYFKISPEKIIVVYEGCDFGPKDYLKKDLLSKLGIVKPYLLYVGNAYPHKNLENLIEVVGKLNLDCQLVLVGRKDFFYNRLEKEIANRDIAKKIIFAGQVSDEELTILYQNARVYVFPSLSEGFGLPGLEAMSCGLPVVASNSSCLPEIYGSAAVYFNPKNILDMKEKIEEVFTQEEIRQKLIKLGYEQVKKYSWKKCAEATLNVYNLFLQNAKNSI
jgi:glycosyltransferase involved in cell wall biosynthesis